jgi:hypothetical protein
MKPSWKPLSVLFLALILTAAAQMLWSLAGGWLWDVRTRLVGGETVIENLYIQIDGTPVIRRYTVASRRVIGREEIFSLDGKRVEKSMPANSARLAPPRDPAHPPEPLEWQNRISSYATGTKPAVFWYLIHDGRPNGLAYFEGFNVDTYLRKGYIGQNGERSDVPPADDRFAVASEYMLANQSWPAGAEPWQALHRIYDQQNERKAYFVSATEAWEIDLENRKPHVLWRGKDAIDMAPILKLQRGLRYGEDDEKPHFVIRTPDRIDVLADNYRVAYSVTIPEPARSATLEAFEFPEGGLLLVTRYFRADLTRVPIYWVPKDGGPAKSHVVELKGHDTLPAPRVLWAGIGALLPAPLLYTAGIGIKAYSDVVDTGEASSLGEALSTEFAAAWPMLVVLVLINLGLAAWVYRRHQSLGQSSPFGWAIFVFLFGVAGLAGYWWHRRWPVRDACPSCRTVVPRDRETCLHCRREFPRPAPLSTEIHV